MPQALIVDDHPLTRAGTMAIIESIDDFNARAVPGAQARSEVRRQLPDIVLMEVDVKEVDPIDLLSWLLRLPDPPRVAVFTSTPIDRYVVTALRLGAAGVILKDTDYDGIVASVRAIATGKTVLCPTVVRQLVEVLERGESSVSVCDQAKRLTARLSPREREILVMVANGLSNAEIACRLFLGTATVKEHVSVILGKLSVKRRLQAALIAFQAGLVNDSPAPTPVVAAAR